MANVSTVVDTGALVALVALVATSATSANGSAISVAARVTLPAEQKSRHLRGLVVQKLTLKRNQWRLLLRWRGSNDPASGWASESEIL